MLLALAARYLARETAPRAEETRCLNYRQPDLCRRCFYSCPHNAILIDHQVTVLDDKCKKCGVCTASCPTRCLELPEANWPKLFSTAIKQEKLYLGCLKAKEIKTNLVVPCLGAIPAEFLSGIAALNNEPFNIDLTPCFDCNSRKALQQLRISMRKAEIMTGSIIRFTARFAESDKTSSANLLDQTNLAIFKRHGKSLASSLTASTNSDYPFFSNDTDKGPLKKQLLLYILKHGQEGSLQVSSWQVGSKCTGCGICSGTCPNSAWEIEHKESMAHLIHKPVLCTNCKLCSKVCPVGAINPILITLDNRTFNRILARSLQTWRCHKCQQIQLGTGKHNNLCASCKKKYETGKKFVQDQKRAICI